MRHDILEKIKTSLPYLDLLNKNKSKSMLLEKISNRLKGDKRESTDQ